jgi:hypothetical protein
VVDAALELNVLLNTNNIAGVVFDYYGESDFKFAAIDAANDFLIIGHVNPSNGEWIYDSVIQTTIDGNLDYELNVSLKDATVSVTLSEVGQNAQAITGYTYNAVTVDGDFGLFIDGGSGYFDSVKVVTSDPAFTEEEGETLLAQSAPVSQTDESYYLTEDMLAPIIQEAISRWSELFTIDDRMVALLNEVNFEIVDFKDLTLGLSTSDTIYLDTDAAGYGWFVDDTPEDDVEFASDDSEADDKMDLLTVVMHEMGHILGYDDVADDADTLMSATLDAGERYEPGDDDSIVLMDTSDLTDSSEESDLLLKAEEEDSWLTDFLVKKAKKDYNPFEPEETFSITMDDKDNKKDKD